MHLVAGIGRPRINSKELLQVMIPLPPKDVQEEIRRQYLSQHQKIENLKSDIGSFLDRSQLMLNSSVQALVYSFIGSPKTTSFMPIENKEMALTSESLRTFLRGESNPLDTLSWLTNFFLPEVLKRLNETDVRRRLGIYAGEKIPENERNLTDVRNRVSLIIEYEFHLFLPGLSGSTEVVAVLYENERVGWQSGEVCFLSSSAVSPHKKQNLVLSQLTVSKVYLLTDKYAWREFEYKKGKLILKRTGKNQSGLFKRI